MIAQISLNVGKASLEMVAICGSSITSATNQYNIAL